MKTKLVWLAISVVALAAAGCGRFAGTAGIADPAKVATPSAAPPRLRAIDTVLYLKPVAISINGKLVERNLIYGAPAYFRTMGPGRLDITAQDVDGKPLADLLRITPEPGADYTLAVIGPVAKPELVFFTHKGRATARATGRLAFLQAGKFLTNVNPGADGKALQKPLPFGTISDYFDFPPGKHIVRVDLTRQLAPVDQGPRSAAPKSAAAPHARLVVPTQTVRLTQPVDFEAGGIYSAIITQLADGTPQLSVIQDKDAPVPTPIPKPTPKPTPNLAPPATKSAVTSPKKSP